MELRLAGITKRFLQNSTTLFELRVDNLALETGRLTYIIGHNGSGKMLLARIVAGELESDADFQSAVVSTVNNNASPHVMLVHQRSEDNVCLELSVEENLAIRAVGPNSLFSLFARPVSNSSWHSNAISRLSCHREVEAGRLSSGERQLLAFECARRGSANVYFLDEFTAALDPSAKRDIMPLVHELAAGEAIVVVISHDLQEVYEHADRVLALVQGQLVYDHQRPTDGWDRATLQELASGQMTPVKRAWETGR